MPVARAKAAGVGADSATSSLMPGRAQGPVGRAPGGTAAGAPGGPAGSVAAGDGGTGRDGGAGAVVPGTVVVAAAAAAVVAAAVGRAGRWAARRAGCRGRWCGGGVARGGQGDGGGRAGGGRRQGGAEPVCQGAHGDASEGASACRCARGAGRWRRGAGGRPPRAGRRPRGLAGGRAARAGVRVARAGVRADRSGHWADAFCLMLLSLRRRMVARAWGCVKWRAGVVRRDGRRASGPAGATACAPRHMTGGKYPGSRSPFVRGVGRSGEWLPGFVGVARTKGVCRRVRRGAGEE
ncbi:hypothetical protein DC74_3678 [Streptomyces noursei]|nr:hypothetical protein DC74_3678 [Streptomyces noursei]